QAVNAKPPRSVAAGVHLERSHQAMVAKAAYHFAVQQGCACYRSFPFPALGAGKTGASSPFVMLVTITVAGCTARGALHCAP
ncbi:MAG: hypothetical protein MUC32_07115, partial [Burkholderiaceae bacterium]|nr:hypothetical protein [Burkholderiaceae bacterium]